MTDKTKLSACTKHNLSSLIEECSKCQIERNRIQILVHLIYEARNGTDVNNETSFGTYDFDLAKKYYEKLGLKA